MSDVFEGEEDEGWRIRFAMETAGVEEHFACADGGEIAIDGEIVEDALAGDDFFEEAAECGDVPLARAEFGEELADGLGGLDVEEFVEGAGGDFDAEVCIEDEEGLARVWTIFSWRSWRRSRDGHAGSLDVPRYLRQRGQNI